MGNEGLRKYSKSDQDPKQIHRDHEGIAKIMGKVSPHWQVGSGVMSNNVRGVIVESGEIVRVLWENNTESSFPNPHYISQ